MKKTLPRSLWAALALAVIGVALLLFATDRRAEPGPALTYDVSGYEKVDPAQVRCAEVARIPLGLENPAGLAVGADGRLFAAGDTLLLVLDPSGKEVSRHDLGMPLHCVAAAPDGVIYAGARDGVLMLSTPDAAPARWEPLGDKAWLTALAADEQFVYAADSGNARVLQYDRAGGLVRQLGEKDAGEGAPRFIVPSHYFDVAFDSMGTLWVVNPGRLGVENYREDGSLLSTWLQPGMALEGFSGCCNPIHIAFRPGNILITAEKGINRVKAYGADRSFLGVVAAPETVNEGWSEFDEAYAPAPVRDLAVDGNGRILVLHGPLRSILVFEEPARGKDVE